MIDVHWVRALKDNYVYILVVDGRAAVVDPGGAAPVEAGLTKLGVRLAEIWCTHHHADHTGAAAELAARHRVDVVGAAADWGRYAGQTRRVADGETFRFCDHEVEAWHVPAHTKGHTAFIVDGNCFPGDTLFGAGCGRLFEGTPAMMHAALRRLAAQ